MNNEIKQKLEDVEMSYRMGTLSLCEWAKCRQVLLTGAMNEKQLSETSELRATMSHLLDYAEKLSRTYHLILASVRVHEGEWRPDSIKVYADAVSIDE